MSDTPESRTAPYRDMSNIGDTTKHRLPPHLALFFTRPTTSCRVHPVAIHRHAMLSSLSQDTLDTSANCTRVRITAPPAKHPELLGSDSPNSTPKIRCLTPLGEERSYNTSPRGSGGLAAAITTACGLSVERRTPPWVLAVDELGIHPTCLGWDECAFRRLTEDIEKRLNFRGLERPPFRRPNHPPGTMTVDDRALASVARLEGRPRSRAAERAKRLLRRDRGATESRDGR